MVVSARSWLANEGGKHLVLMLWLGTNSWLFVKTFLMYSGGLQYHYLYKMLGLGLCISRASASVLNLNCSLVLLPMCRSLLTFVRGTHAVSSRKTRRLLDKSKTFHVACGVAICIFSVVHVSAHLVNVVNFSRGYSEDFPALNLARYKGEDPEVIILTTVPGVTGVLLVLILFLMFTSSSHCVRIHNYEIFWYTHNLFIIFYVILMVHMVGGALKYQSNVEAHPPGCSRANRSVPEEPERRDDAEMRCGEEARFQAHCPQCPTENKETFGVHLRVVGDWTERFTQLLLPDTRRDLDILPVVHQRRYPKLYVDGPFGSPSEEVFNYDVSLCVAGGIGVTPFACVLHALLDGWKGFRLKRLYFVWVCRELQSFYWFTELLCALHHKLWHENRPDYLNLKLYISQADNRQCISEERYRPLASRLLVGRPRWKLLFDDIGRTNKHKRVGVFCCGPKGISRTLRRLCNSARFPGTTFEFNKESFS
ncbi:NADPH oxidase 4 isoform X2 [Syngnathoides biaculeatus]|uniref:NADPH oxidase 4 isoform X2 n=1 Tax=Syngnathoides biaculeatus TaxID=300417 RepID=UPI002ADD32EC|nr:NADPH oxidase 4 isoform X2 [Syngnathoides biaculeatus]